MAILEFVAYLEIKLFYMFLVGIFFKNKEEITFTNTAMHLMHYYLYGILPFVSKTAINTFWYIPVYTHFQQLLCLEDCIFFPEVH